MAIMITTSSQAGTRAAPVADEQATMARTAVMHELKMNHPAASSAL
jgi:hypothetical protein